MAKPKLKALQESAKKNRYLYDQVKSGLLETFPVPPRGPKFSVLRVRISVPEFTCLCPVTGQPDFATIHIDYTPNKLCLESKALKQYLMGFRQCGMFHEDCVQVIADHLIQLLDPRFLLVRGKFAPRGGIPFHPEVTYISPNLGGPEYL